MKPLKCEKCDLPFMVVRGRKVHVKSRHHGRTHTNVVDILDLIDAALSEDSGTDLAWQILEKIQNSGIMIRGTYSA